MSLESVQKAREEVRKQFMSRVDSLAKCFQHPQSFEDIEEAIKLREAIDALDQAIAKGWAHEPLSESPHSESRTWMEAVELPGDERG